MDTENSTNLYLQVCQTLFSCDYENPSTFSDLYKLLPWLRQSLTCCVCSSVLQDPMSSTESTCQHFICAGCKGKPMVLKPSCSWCKDSSFFEKNSHLAVLVMLFSKICQYIVNSPIKDHAIAYDKEQQDIQVAESSKSNSDACKNQLGKSTKKGKGKKKISSNPRKRLTTLSFPIMKVLNDGLEVKTSLLDWLDVNVNASTDINIIKPDFFQAHTELCPDQLSQLLESTENELSDVSCL